MANFRPNKWKVILSLSFVIIWYLLIFTVSSLTVIYCKTCPTMVVVRENCQEISAFRFFPEMQSCDCSCTTKTFKATIKAISIQLFIMFFPGILVYLIWSFAQQSLPETKKTKKILQQNKKAIKENKKAIKENKSAINEINEIKEAIKTKAVSDKIKTKKSKKNTKKSKKKAKKKTKETKKPKKKK